MRTLHSRVEKLEEQANPPGKVIVFMQDMDNPDLYRYLKDGINGDVTSDQARAMTRPQDSVIWLNVYHNQIAFQGPDAEEKRANFEAMTSNTDSED